MAASSYPEEVWAALREIWEITPKMSFNKAAKEIATILKCEVPAGRVVANRAKREGWEKSFNDLRKNTGKELNDLIKHCKAQSELDSDVLSDSDENSDNLNDDDSDILVNSDKKTKTKNNQIVKTTKLRNGKAKLDVDINQRKLTAAIVMHKSRIRLAKLGELTSYAMEGLGDLMQNDIANFDWDNPEEWEKLEAKVKLSNALIQQIGSLSLTMSAITKAEKLFWGLEVEDLKDKAEVNATLSAKAAEAQLKLEEAKLKMKQQALELKQRQTVIDGIATEIEQGGGAVDE